MLYLLDRALYDFSKTVEQLRRHREGAKLDVARDYCPGGIGPGILNFQDT